MAESGNKYILIVDDAKGIQSLLEEFLQGEGYMTSSADNGKDALNFLRGVPILPSLILLDLMMPEMDGYQFRLEQKKDPKLAQVPVVIMTADGSIQSKAMQIGAEGFLKKPFTDLDAILKTVEQYLK